MSVVLLRQGAEVAQRKIDRRKGVVITGPPVVHVHRALFQRELLDDHAWQAGVCGSFVRSALKRGQQLGEIEFTVGRDRQVRARCGDADVGKTPGTPDQGFPLQCHGEFADREQRRAIGLGQA